MGTYGGVAQLGEHLPCKQGVMGSNPIISTKVTTEGESVVTSYAGFEGEAEQSELPVDVRDRGRPSAQFARESNPIISTKVDYTTKQLNGLIAQLVRAPA